MDNDCHLRDHGGKSSPKLFKTINRDNCLIEIMAPKEKGSLSKEFFFKESYPREEREWVTGDLNPKRKDTIQSKAVEYKRVGEMQEKGSFTNSLS